MTSQEEKLTPFFRWRLLPLLFFVAAVLPAQSRDIFISSIRFEGNRAFSELQLKRMIPYASEGSRYSAGQLESGLRAIESFYHDEGFPNARVGPPDVQFQESAGRESAVIRRPVSEGPGYAMGQLEIRNAHVFEIQTLSQMLSLKQGQTFSRRKILQWQGKIEEAYHTMGYIRFSSLVRQDVNYKTKSVDVTVEFTEGRAYSIGKISVAGNDSVDLLDFKRHLLFGEGGVFNPDVLNTTIYYLNQTHRYPPISPSDIEIRIDDTHATVDLIWHIKPRVSAVGE